MTMWEYTCSACGSKFGDAVRVCAEQKFRDHAEAVHRPKAVLTIHTEGNER